MRRRIVELFAAFFKIGLFTFGGGYAMISLIEDEVARRRGWIGEEELTEVFELAGVGSSTRGGGLCSHQGPVAMPMVSTTAAAMAAMRGSHWYSVA